jgi:hypothetical protein
MAMIGSGVGWLLARKAAQESARYAKRSADAAELSAEADQTQARIAEEQVAAAERKPWDIQAIPGSDNCQLRNKTARPRYEVRVEGPAVRQPDVGTVDGNGVVEIDTMLSVWGLNKAVTITWHLARDLSDEPGVQETQLPNRIG